MADDKKKVSFGFSKKSDQKLLQDSKIRDEATKDKREEKDFVLSLQHKHIESSVPKAEKTELVIPLISKNNWRLPSTVAGSNVKAVDGADATDLDAQAAKEILEVTKKLKDDESEEKAESDLTIPIFMQNRIPEGFETDEKVDVTLRPDESSMEDYDRVPIEQFGLAVLRGMGWKPTGGIGSTNKRVVAPVEAVLRPKGLGLGADPKSKSKMTSAANSVAAKEPEEKLQLVVGAYVHITDGAHKDKYGQVEGLDMDNARVIVKLSVNSKTVSVQELVVEVIGEKEYKRDSKLINKSSYEEYRAKSDARMEAQREESRRHSSHERRHRHRDDDRHAKRSKHGDHRQEAPHSDRKSETSSSAPVAPSSAASSSSPWVRQLLRVRFIERTYKSGRYFNTKVIIEDVTQKNVCICRTESGHVLEDIPARWLETIVPKSSPPYVMVVRGKYKGQLAEIVDREPDNCLATLQLIQEKEVVQLDYDSICEYSGKASDY